jgi:oligosaccharide repeat unit polymerase
MNDTHEHSQQKNTSIFPINPEIFLLITSILCFASWLSGDEILDNFGISGWRFDTTSMIKCQGLILVLYLGYLIGKSNLLRKGTKKTIKSSNWDFAKVHRLGKKITIIGICSHVIWFVYSFAIVGTQFGVKLATIPGLTTLTQVLPVGIACMYLAHKKNNILSWNKWFSASVIIVAMRSILNSERLALLELAIPLCVIYIFFNQGRKAKQGFRIVSIGFLGAYLLFLLLEYLRSWQYYQFRWNGSYFSFINDRIGLYYVTSWNNGAIYSNFWNESESRGRAFFAIINEFPLFGALLNSITNEDSGFSKWFGTLNSAVGTAEFNNPNYLIVAYTDLTYLGAMFWFALVGIIIGNLFKEVQRKNLMALIAYACTVIALFDLPRVGWWTATRSVPVYLALTIVYYSRLKKDHYESAEIK